MTAQVFTVPPDMKLQDAAREMAGKASVEHESDLFVRERRLARIEHGDRD